MENFQDITQFIQIFIITLTIIWLFSKFLEYRKLPPGPFGLPFLGYVPFMKKPTYEAFQELEQKYGKVFSLSIGSTRCVIINDGRVAKQVLSNPAAYGRPKAFNQMLPGNGGFAGENGKKWIENRRFCVNAMKNLGLGRGEWETMIHDEAIEFIKEIRSWNGEATVFHQSLEFFQINNMLSLLIGRRLCDNKDSKVAQILMSFTNEIIPFLSSASFSHNLPLFILKLFSKLKISNYDIAFDITNKFETIIRREIKRHIETRKPEQQPNFIDYYVEEYNKAEKNGNLNNFSDYGSLVGNITILFLAAIDTTTSSLHWILLLTAFYPEIQKKIHKEIDENLGKDRLIYWDERNNLPYTMATINEMLRWVATAPVFPGRWLSENIQVDNYVIPKNTVIMVNNWRVLHNNENFEDPFNFKPERFLKTEENDKKSENFFPFSIGKRNCPGEHVAMMTVFLFYTAIMQKFQILGPKNKSIKLIDNGSSVVRHAIPQELCFIER